MQSINNIIGFHSFRQDNKITIVASDGNIIDKPPYFTKLVTKYKDYTCIAYDLDYLASCLFYAIQLTQEQGATLHKKERLYIPPWKIAYFPNIFLGIDYGAGEKHPFVNFCNMNQEAYGKAVYSSEQETLESAIAKAKEARDIGIKVTKIMTELGLDNSSIISPVSPFLRKYTLNWPTVDGMPSELIQMSIDAVKGHMFEVQKLGKFQLAKDWDINSAYLWHLSYLPNILNGEFIEVIGNEIPIDAKLGVAEGYITTEAPLHPWMVDINGVYHNTNGTFPNTITLFDIELMYQYHELGSFHQEKGWYWCPKGGQSQPYKGVMMYLWKQRQNTEGIKRDIIQRIYSALDGKQIEGITTGKYGEMLCPIIPAHVHAATRIQVIKTCLEHKVDPIAITGDGFISDSETDIPCGEKMGEWKLKQQSDLLSISSNILLFKDGKMQDEYKNIITNFINNPKTNHYSGTYYTPINLPLALSGAWKDLALIKQAKQGFSIDSETKRFYTDRPKNGYDLIHNEYKSIPWDYNTLTTITDST